MFELLRSYLLKHLKFSNISKFQKFKIWSDFCPIYVFEILYKSLCTSNAERGTEFSVLEFLGCIEFSACYMNFM